MMSAKTPSSSTFSIGWKRNNGDTKVSNSIFSVSPTDTAGGNGGGDRAEGLEGNSNPTPTGRESGGDYDGQEWARTMKLLKEGSNAGWVTGTAESTYDIGGCGVQIWCSYARARVALHLYIYVYVHPGKKFTLVQTTVLWHALSGPRSHE